MRARRMLVVACAALLIVGACSGDDADGDAGDAGTEGDSTEGVPAAELVFAPVLTERTLAALTSAYEDETGTTVLVRTATSDELSEMFQEETSGVYVNTVEAVEADVAEGTPVSHFGNDVLQLAVLRGNPEGVSGLEVFADGSTTPTGMCPASLECGSAALAALQAADVEPGSDVVVDRPGPLLNQLTGDQSIDAILLFRTQLRQRFNYVEAVPLADSYTLDYDIALTGDNAAATGFYEWVTTSDEAQELLRARGLAPLIG